MTDAAIDAAPDVEAIAARLRRRIGLRSAPLTIEVEKGAIRDFARATGEEDRIYFDEEYARASRFGGLPAPPTYVSRWLPDVLHPGLLDLDLPLKRVVHGDDIVTNHRPILAGDVITAVGTFAEVFVKQGRQGPMLFQVVDVALTNQRGEAVADVRVSSVSF